MAISDSDSKDLKALDRAADRVIKANLPQAPYVVSLDAPSSSGPPADHHQWTRNSPFSIDEGHLQYQSLLYRDTSDTMLKLQAAGEPNYWTTTGQANPKSGATTPLPLNAASATKKKISLSDYKSRREAGSQGTTPAAHAAQSHAPDLRKEILKKEFTSSDSIAKQQAQSQPTTSAPKPEVVQDKKPAVAAGHGTAPNEPRAGLDETPAIGQMQTSKSSALGKPQESVLHAVASKRSADSMDPTQDTASSTPMKKHRSLSPAFPNTNPFPNTTPASIPHSTGSKRSAQDMDRAKDTTSSSPTKKHRGMSPAFSNAKPKPIQHVSPKSSQPNPKSSAHSTGSKPSSNEVERQKDSKSVLPIKKHHNSSPEKGREHSKEKARVTVNSILLTSLEGVMPVWFPNNSAGESDNHCDFMPVSFDATKLKGASTVTVSLHPLVATSQQPRVLSAARPSKTTEKVSKASAHKAAPKPNRPNASSGSFFESFQKIPPKPAPQKDTPNQAHHKRLPSAEQKNPIKHAEGLKPQPKGAIKKRPMTEVTNAQEPLEKRKKLSDNPRPTSPRTLQTTQPFPQSSFCPSEWRDNPSPASSNDFTSEKEQIEQSQDNSQSSNSIASASRGGIQEATPSSGQVPSQDWKKKYEIQHGIAKQLRAGFKEKRKNDDRSADADEAALKATAVEGLESVLFFMKAFMAQTINSDDPDRVRHAWYTILPWVEEVRYHCERWGFHHLRGFAALLCAVCRQKYIMCLTRIKDDENGASTPFGTVPVEAMWKQFKQVQIEGNESAYYLSRDILKEEYFEAYSKTSSQPLHKPMPPKTAIRFGRRFLLEWTIKNNVRWDARIYSYMG